jgi:hypothetical protein
MQRSCLMDKLSNGPRRPLDLETRAPGMNAGAGDPGQARHSAGSARRPLNAGRGRGARPWCDILAPSRLAPQMHRFRPTSHRPTWHRPTRHHPTRHRSLIRPNGGGGRAWSFARPHENASHRVRVAPDLNSGVERSLVQLEARWACRRGGYRRHRGKQWGHGKRGQHRCRRLDGSRRILGLGRLDGYAGQCRLDRDGGYPRNRRDSRCWRDLELGLRQ